MRRSASGANQLLLLKVWRDAVALGGASVSLVALMALGCALYVLFAQSRLNLELSYHSFYRDHRLADATILVEEAPESLVETIALLPGVKTAMGRVVKDGTIILRDSPRRRTSGRFIGVPSTGRPALNDVFVIEGRYLTDRGECLVDRMYAKEHRLGVGSVLRASYLGRQHDFAVVGIVASPEYIYPAPSKEASFASPGFFGICWVDGDALRQWVGMNRSITEVHVACDPRRVERVLEAMVAVGERYGLRSWWDQVEQPSNRLLSMDLTGFRAMSVVFPLLFMSAAGLSLYSSLTRIVRLQTGVVGFLRASGFEAAAVGWHYVLQGGLLTACGALPGAVFGHWGSIGFTRLYANSLHLPRILTPPHWLVLVSGVVTAGLVGILAAWLPARQAARTPPAVAMRGDRQEDELVGNLNWLMKVTRLLPVSMRIAARGLVRHPSRTLFAVAGLVSGTSLLLATLGMHASIMSALDEWIYDALDYELDVSFVSQEGAALADAVGALPGVTGVVHTCLATVDVTSATGRTVTLNAMGYQRGQRLFRFAVRGGPEPDLQPGYLWLTKQTARRLGVERGDPLRVEWAFSSRERTIWTTMRVGGVLDLTFGGFGYGDYDDLRRRIVDRIYPSGGYGAMIACSSELGVALRRRLERDDLVAAVMSINDIKKEIEASMKITLIFIGVMLSFGCLLAGAVLHSVSSISILERLRELATLRSLGFSARATTLTAAVEIYAMAALGLLGGLPLGAWMNTAYMRLFETETFSFRAVTPLWAYVDVILIVLVLVAVSLRGGVQRLRTMDLAQATKALE